MGSWINSPLKWGHLSNQGVVSKVSTFRGSAVLSMWIACMWWHTCAYKICEVWDITWCMWHTQHGTRCAAHVHACLFPCSLTEREKRDFEYKKTVYQLARDHEKVSLITSCTLTPAGVGCMLGQCCAGPLGPCMYPDPCWCSLQAAELEKEDRYHIPSEDTVS